MFFKSLLYILILSLSLAQAKSLKNLVSYQANFTQTILDQDDVKVAYTGVFKAKKPLRALWSYKTPIEKDLYINSRQIVLVEPELEQAIYRESNENFTLFNLLNTAHKINETTYIKVIGDQSYRLKIKGDIIESIMYKDNFENRVVITFSEQKPNITLKSSLFNPKIPEDFDILHE